MSESTCKESTCKESTCKESTCKNEKQELKFLTVRDVSKIMGISLPLARQIFDRPEFPKLQIGRRILVCEEAFRAWASQRRV